LPDEILANFGLQKIPATAEIPQYRSFKEGDIVESEDRYINEDGNLEEFHPNAIGKVVGKAIVNTTRHLKFVKNPGK
jgi:hypothetical protein